MFNASLIEISEELNNGLFDRYNPIVEAVYETHYNMIEMSIDAWELNDPSDAGFIRCFQYAFPPGFIMRDISRAKRIIYDLKDIAEGFTVRYTLKPIYIYVMYHLIMRWCEILEDIYDDVEDRFPEKIQKYLKEKEISTESEFYQSVKRWFTLENEMAEDFASVYDEDCTDKVMAESIAFMYLEDEYADEKIKSLDVNVEDFFDLLPSDLYERVMEKHKSEQDLKKKLETEQLQKNAAKELIKEIDLKKEIVYACIKLSEAPQITSGLNENGLNRLLRDCLESSLKSFNYCVQDQTQRGYSATGNEAGELDLRIIDRDGFPEAICECLIHKDEKYLHEHISKVVYNYNQIGCKTVYIICYSRNKDYKRFWESFKNWVKKCELVSGWEAEDTQKYGGIRCAEGLFDCFGDTGIIHYIGVNLCNR